MLRLETEPNTKAQNGTSAANVDTHATFAEQKATLLSGAGTIEDNRSTLLPSNATVGCLHGYPDSSLLSRISHSDYELHHHPSPNLIEARPLW